MENIQNLTKLILNNQIVDFRKSVRQSRVHCIRKLSRDIKKLKEKKGTDEQKTKNLKKAERYVEEIFCMKKLKDDEISKFALSNERTLNDITNDINESLEKKALARLVHHKAVADKVHKFRESFPEWKNCLEYLLETLGEKYKLRKSIKTPKKKSKVKSRTSKIENKSGTWEVQPLNWKKSTSNVDVTTNVRDSIDESTDVKSADAKELQKPARKLDERNGNKFIDTKIKSVDSMKLQEPGRKPDERNSDKSIDTKERHKSSRKLKKHIDEDNPTKKLVHKGIIEKKSTNDRADEVSETVSDESSESCTPEKESNAQGGVDSFFLTKDNVEYVSVFANPANANSSQNQQEFKPHQRDREEFDNNVRFKQRGFGHPYKQREFSDRGFKKRESQPKRFGKQEYGRDYRQYDHRKEGPVKPEPSLHPSWEAKKKQAAQSVRFEGKKIKFDDS